MKAAACSIACLAGGVVLTASVLRGEKTPTGIVPLSFQPNTISVEGDVPGVRVMETTVTNAGKTERQDLQIRYTCGCITILEPKGHFSLRPGESRKVRFQMTQTKAIDVNQALYVMEGDRTTGDEQLQIHGKLREVLVPGTWSSPSVAFTRPFSGLAATNGVITVDAAPGVRVQSCTPGVSWMRTDVRQAGTRVQLRFEALAGSPDGPSDVPLVCEYVSRGRKEISELTIPITIASEYAVSVRNLWFGKITAEKAYVRSFDVEGKGVARRVRFVSDSPQLQVKSEPRGEDSVTVTCTLKTPKGSRMFHGSILCQTGEKERSGKIEVAALAN